MGTAPGLVVAVLVLTTGLGSALQRSTEWTATSSLLVAPRAANTDPDTLASLYDTLSRGQVAATYAELFRGAALKAAAGDRLGLSEDDRRRVRTGASVVPETSIVDVTATAPSAELAERMTDSLAQVATTRVEAMTSPYGVTTTSSAAGTAARGGLGQLELAVLALLAALVAGALVQQAWQSAVLRRRPAAAARVPDAGDWPAVAMTRSRRTATPS